MWCVCGVWYVYVCDVCIYVCGVCGREVCVWVWWVCAVGHM